MYPAERSRSITSSTEDSRAARRASRNRNSLTVSDPRASERTA